MEATIKVKSLNKKARAKHTNRGKLGMIFSDSFHTVQVHDEFLWESQGKVK